jgi:hypothetical protein
MDTIAALFDDPDKFMPENYPLTWRQFIVPAPGYLDIRRAN